MAEERVQPIALHQEMQRSYLEYAMSVIVGRASTGCARWAQTGSAAHPLRDA